MTAMKRLTLIGFATCLLLPGLLTGCARQENNQSSTNDNAPQNSNSPAATAASGTPLSVQQVPFSPPASSTAAKPAQTPENQAPAAASATGRVPKLVAPEKRVNFGKQPQDKNLVRAIAIRNGGKADLKIESVVPS